MDGLVGRLNLIMVREVVPLSLDTLDDFGIPPHQHHIPRPPIKSCSQFSCELSLVISVAPGPTMSPVDYSL